MEKQLKKITYNPKPDITAWELALALKLVTAANRRFNSFESNKKSVIHFYTNSPPEVQRHFDCVWSDDEGGNSFAVVEAKP